MCNHIQSEKTLQLYEQSLSLNISTQTIDCYFSISLLNHYITQTKLFHETTGLLLGFKHEGALNVHFDAQNINPNQLLISLGNETRLSILRALTEQNELTATAIAKTINTPLTTVLRYIEILNESGALFISKKKRSADLL